MNHLYLSQLIFNRPLLISERKLETILSVLGPRFEGRIIPTLYHDDEPMVLERKEQESPSTSIAMISILGSLVNRTFGMEAWSGLESYHGLREELQAAVENDAVHGIVLDIDSPGGEVSGCFDLSDAIHEASTKKPILALVDENCFSAAYALASAASRIVLPRTGAVGSIGVLAVHMDQSEMDKDLGLRYTFIKAGKHKDEMNPHAPLKSEARIRLQAEVDRVYDIFVSTVARYRKVDPEKIRQTEAGLFFGEEAVEAGLADKIQSREEALDTFIADVQRRWNPSVAFFGADTLPVLGAITEGEIEMGKADIVQPTATNTSAQPTAESAPPKADTTKPPAPAAPLVQPTAETNPDMVSASYVAEVQQLCQLAGKPQLASKYIAGKFGADLVRNALLEARAKEDEAMEIVGTPPVQIQPSAVKVEPHQEVFDRWQRQMSGKA